MKPELAILSLFTASAIPVAIAQGVRSEVDAPLVEASTPAVPTEPASGISATFWWGDFDGDGLLDAYAIAPAGKGYLLRNLGNGSFEDVTHSAALGDVEAPTVAAWEDFDCDGHLDLFLGTAFGPARLLHSLGNASFEPVEFGVDHLGWDERATWIDYDADGLPDLHVRTRRCDHLYHNLGSGLFEAVELGLGEAPPRFEPPSVEGAGSAGLSTPPAPSPAAGNPAAGGPPAAPGGRRPAGPGGGSGPPSSSPGPGPGSSVTPAGPSAPGPSPTSCLDSILDQASGVNCLNASSVPTYGMLYPLGPEFNIDALGNVGMGTTSPSAHLDVSGGATAIRAYTSHGGGIGVNVSSLGALGFAIKGEASSDSGTGVYGAHTASTGDEPGVHGVTYSSESGATAVLGKTEGGGSETTMGVWGVTDSLVGYGVLGEAQYASGSTASGVMGVTPNDGGYGVRGEAYSIDGVVYGVRGYSSSSNGGGVQGVGETGVQGEGIAYGVVGLSDDPDGTGVYGEVTSTMGTGPGVHGVTRALNHEGIGVLGEDSGGNGTSIAVKGMTTSTEGTGVAGEALAGSGPTYGVTGVSFSPDGMGVAGWHASSAGTSAGVYGKTSSTQDGAAAVLGEADATTGEVLGVCGVTASAEPGTAGVLGEASSTTGQIAGVWGTTESVLGTGVYGEANAATGQTYGVVGLTSSDEGTGVWGYHANASGTSPGVSGVTDSEDLEAAGVLGVATATAGQACGVRGVSDAAVSATGVEGTATTLSTNGGIHLGVYGAALSPTGQGVQGAASANTGYTAGVSGFVASPDGTAVFGRNDASEGDGLAVWGWTNSAQGTAILGEAHSTMMIPSIGVHGKTWSSSYASVGVLGEYMGTGTVDAAAVKGKSIPAAYYGLGGDFEGGWVGVRGQAIVTGSGARYGGRFIADGGDSTLYGVYAEAQDPQDNNNAYGIYAHADFSDGWAGWFAGDTHVNGTLSKSGGAFKIDHPLDPENKYLYHSFVESPDMMNVYNGNVLLDGDGVAWVELPEWFEALNREFRYQLTAIGAPGPNLYVAQKVTGNRFQIAGGTPHSEVSWQVTGIRQDPYAEAHRIPLEVMKAPAERGTYLNPEARGLPEERGTDYVIHRKPVLEKEKARQATEQGAKAAKSSEPRPAPRRAKTSGK